MATAGRDHETIIREFFASWPERNVERFLEYFTDDAVYHNMLRAADSAAPRQTAPHNFRLERSVLTRRMRGGSDAVVAGR